MTMLCLCTGMSKYPAGGKSVAAELRSTVTETRPPADWSLPMTLNKGRKTLLHSSICAGFRDISYRKQPGVWIMPHVMHDGQPGHVWQTAIAQQTTLKVHIALK